MPRARVVSSIAEIGRQPWDRLFPGALEGFDYLWAVESAGMKGFDWRYVVIEAAGAVVAATPMFLTTYGLDTTLPTAGRRMVEGVRRLFPGALNLRLAALGSPCTETLAVGFAPEAGAADRTRLMGLLLDAFEAEAAVASAGLLGVKDVPDDQATAWHAVLGARGYRGVGGLPVASLDIEFASVEAYLATLSAATRKDMRRKLRSRSQVRVEWRDDLTDVLDRVADLYRQTRARAEMAFEDLTPAYFAGVLSAMGPRASCVLYWKGEDLLAANLLLRNETTLIDKFFVMDGDRGRALDLYFLSWFENIEYCVRSGLRRYESGAAAYAVKLKLGSRLDATTLYFRHRNALLNHALGLAAPLFAADASLEVAA